MIQIWELNKYYFPHIGGIETVVRDIAEGLCNKTDMHVLVCATSRKSDEETLNDVKVHRSGRLFAIGSMPISFRYLLDVRRAAKRADILHLHMPFPWGDLALRLSGYKGKVVLWWHSDIVRQKKLMWLYRPLMEWTLRRADYIVTATEGHVRGSQFLQPYKSKCRYISFAVDENCLRKGVLALEKKKTHEDIRILFIGRLVYYKGCDVLLDAFSAMQNKDCKLILVGAGPLRERLETQAKCLGIQDRTMFTGKLERADLEKQLEECDYFVLPSVLPSEAFGLVQMEAMAYGKPVINTNLPTGVPWVSLHGKTGLTVEPGNIDALAAAMDTLAFDEKLRREYGIRARERVENEFTQDRMCAAVLALYKELCTE